MDSIRELMQPTRTSSPDSVYAEDKPQWTHEEYVPIKKNEERIPSSHGSQKDKQHSLLTTALNKANADPSPQEWLTLASENARILSPQTRQLIESFASLQTALSAVSSLSSRRHSRSSSSSSASSACSSASTSSSAGFLGLHDVVEEQERGLQRLCDSLIRETDEEVEEAILERSRRDLAKKKLKEDEAKGIQIMRQSLGLPPVNCTTSGGRPMELGRSQSTIAVQTERAKTLNQENWRKTW
ncbi:hypothetical protein PG994_013590 [Apiospora phragmitis]|uniref:Uncharacterized protein n=1 Tax=Apiospora phragmitis TaxID=2905665 RepID=A0ABR1T931_9PEZI